MYKPTKEERIKIMVDGINKAEAEIFVRLTLNNADRKFIRLLKKRIKKLESEK